LQPHRATTRILAALALAPLALGSLATAVAASDAPAEESVVPVEETVPGRIVISWTGNATAAERAAVRDRHGLDSEEAFGPIEVVRVPDRSVAGIADALEAEAAVEIAEPDFVVETATNDPGYNQLWGLHNTGQSGGVVDIDIDAPEAWTTTRGSADVIVAVIDTGIDVSHPDLAANIWRNRGEIAGNGIDDDRNGYVDDVNGWDFVANDNSVYDSSSEDFHGTHVAGTIAAAGDNGIGIVGVAPRVRIMPVKALGGAEGTGSSSAAAAAVRYAYANGATVINMSWGGGSSETLKNVIASSSRAVFLAAAGNEGVDIDVTNPQYPAAWAADRFGVSNIVSVAAVDRFGGIPGFSNYGSTSIDIGAPGASVISTAPGSQYASASGTSMATPHASGVAALLGSVDPSLSGSQVANAVKAGGQALSSLSGRTTTGRLLNARGALLALAGASATTTTPTTSSPTTTSPTSPTTTAPTEPAPTEPTPTTEPAPYDGTGARSLDWACPGVTESGFSDVPVTSVHAPGVGCAGDWGVFTGSGTTFSPNADLTRGQLASVLVRAIEEALGSPLPTAPSMFTDDDTSVHRAAIDKLAALGIVTGVSPTSYAPGASVTRGQFATMLARTFRHLAGTIPTGSDAFRDDDGNPHEWAIDALASLGIVGGTADGSYGANTDLSRAQSATLVSRLLDALVEAQVIDGR
jgi:subtilisin family serine protease